MTKHLLTQALLAATLGFMATEASAQVVVFSDSFDRAALGSGDGNGNPLGSGNGISDWGSNDNALGGSAVQTYTFGQGRAGGANQTTDGTSAQMIAGAVQIEFDFATVAPEGFSVSFDFERVVDFGNPSFPTGNGYLAVALGVDDTDQIENQTGFNGNAFIFTNSANGADAAAVFRQDTGGDPTLGSVEFWAGGDTPDLALDGFFSDPHDTPHSAVVTFEAPNGYGSGETGTLTIEVDGAPGFSNNFTFDGASSGYLSLYTNIAGDPSNARFAMLDNLVVTALGNPPSADLDADGDVDVADGLKWQRDDGSLPGRDLFIAQFGQGELPLSAAGAVPEPSTALSAAAAAIVLGFRRRRS